MSYLGTLSLVLITTALAGHFSRRVGMPAVIGELLVGIVLGPAVLGLVTNNSFVHTFSEIGVIILMFIAGLESDLELLKKYLKPAFSVAVCGVIVPVGLVFLFGKLFSFSNEQAIFLGVTFAATSVSISVEVLKELHFLDSKEGTTILGAAVIDDILAVLILSVLVSIFSQIGRARPVEHRAFVGASGTVFCRNLSVVQIHCSVPHGHRRKTLASVFSGSDVRLYLHGHVLSCRRSRLEQRCRRILCRRCGCTDALQKRNRLEHRTDRVCGVHPDVLRQHRTQHDV